MPLDLVLYFKIGVTALFWAFPLLLLPRGVFRRLGFPDPLPMVFMRLLGAAYLALGVGYVRGLMMLKGGQHPADTILVGLVSNGLACALLVGYGLAGRYAEWGRLARLFMWMSAGLTGIITLGLFLNRT
jgi:hypothetical protein